LPRLRTRRYTIIKIIAVHKTWAPCSKEEHDTCVQPPRRRRGKAVNGLKWHGLTALPRWHEACFDAARPGCGKRIAVAGR